MKFKIRSDQKTRESSEIATPLKSVLGSQEIKDKDSCNIITHRRTNKISNNKT